MKINTLVYDLHRNKEEPIVVYGGDQNQTRTKGKVVS